MTVPIQDTGDLDSKLIVDILDYAIQRVEIRRPPNTGAIFPIYGKEVIDYAKAAIQHSYIRKSDVLAKALGLIGEDEAGLQTSSDPNVAYGVPYRNNLRLQSEHPAIRRIPIKKDTGVIQCP